MANQLPHELWRHIASFISLKHFEESRLYALSSPFLECYLRKKYQHMSLGYHCGSYFRPSPGKFENRLNQLRLPMIARNVEILNIHLAEHRPKERDTSKGIVERFNAVLVGLRVRKKPEQNLSTVPNFPSRESIGQCLGSLKNLSTIKCTLVCNNDLGAPVIDFRYILPVGISAAWSASRNTLTSLSLTVVTRLTYFPDFGLSNITFPNLREFGFTFRRPKHTSKSDWTRLADEAHASLLPFLYQHSKAITKLSISLSEEAHRFSNAFFLGLPYFLSLRDLSIRTYLQPDSSLLSGLSRQFRFYSKGLERLQLYLGIPFHSRSRYTRASNRQIRQNLAWWKSQSFLRTSFPQLKHLDCTFERSDDNELLLWYLSNIAYQGSTLVLQRLSHNNIHVLTGMFEGQRRLERLHLSVLSFTPSLLELLATRLPHLKLLYVAFQLINLKEEPPEKIVTESLSSSAYDEFAGKTYPDCTWDDIVLDNHAPQEYHRPLLFKDAITKALPNVGRFNGVTREKYLSTEQNYCP